MKTTRGSRPALLLLIVAGLASTGNAIARDEPAAEGLGSRPLQKVGAAQPAARLIDWRIAEPAAVLEQVEQSLDALEAIVRRAGVDGCDALALPEDTLGLMHWEFAHPDLLAEVLPVAVARMIERLGRAAAEHRMYLVCCNDTVDGAGTLRNTAILLGRDGREVGRYHKVNLPLYEQKKARGDGFPVFPTDDLGGVGMLICYDMVFPEAARCLALGGADVVFHPTLGGAAIGGDDISRAAFRTRAAENFVYLVVANRGSGSMIVSPRGEVLAEADGPDAIAVAEIDPLGGRAGGDALGRVADMRARLFRERSPAAFGILTDPDPPALAKVPAVSTPAEAARIAAGVLTVGEDRFREADALLRRGDLEAAAAAFERLRDEYPGSWIDVVSRERLATIAERRSRP